MSVNKCGSKETVVIPASSLSSSSSARVISFDRPAADQMTSQQAVVEVESSSLDTALRGGQGKTEKAFISKGIVPSCWVPPIELC